MEFKMFDWNCLCVLEQNLEQSTWDFALLAVTSNQDLHFEIWSEIAGLDHQKF